MAIPDDYTFSATDVCAELQFSGASGSPTAKLSNFFTDSPQASYCSSYSGSTDCLRNYRGYSLLSEFSCNISTSKFCEIAYDDTNNYMWGTFYTSGSECLVSVNVENNAMSAHTGTGRGRGIAFDGTNMWYTGGAYKCIGKINTSTGAVTKYTGFNKCPMQIAYDGSNMWTTGFDIVTPGEANRYYKITSAGVITEYICASICCGIGMTYDGSSIWIGSSGNNSVAKINTSTGAATTYSGTGSCPIALTYDGTYIWSANIGNNSVSRITTTGTITNFTGLPGSTLSARVISSDGTHVWVTNTSCPSITRICQDGTMRTYSYNSSRSTFSGLNYDSKYKCMWVSVSGSPMVIQKIGAL